ncbi:CENPX protein, partial [Eolophus roseicapillus]|nr:CENPX protein [Eolophus roseicapilla]
LSRLPALLSMQETVDRLLRLHFRDGRTRVNGDAQLLMVEMLNVFVRGELPVPGPRSGGAIPVPHPPSTRRSPSSLPSAEAAARAVRQAQAEDLEKVDVEHVEKVLPQLVCTG